MSPRLIRAALRCYPAAMRERYGAEVTELLESSPTPWRDLANVVRCGIVERLERRVWTFTLVIPVAIVFAMFEDPEALGILMPALLICLGTQAGAWLGNRHTGPWFHHQLLATLFISLFWLLSGWVGLAVYVIWTAVVMGLAAWVRALRRRSRAASLAVAVTATVILPGVIMAVLAMSVIAQGLVPILDWGMIASGGIPAYDPVTDSGYRPYGIAVPLPMFMMLLAFVLAFAFVSGGKHTTQTAKVGLTLT